MSVLFGLFIEERASEEDGGALLNRELVMLTTTRAEAEEFADITDGLTPHISCAVKAVEVTGNQYRVVQGASL